MKRETYHIIFISLFGLLGSIFTGLIFVGISIFNFQMNYFQFVTAGLAGALFFALFKFKSSKELVWGFVFIFILELVLFSGRAISMTYVIRDFIFTSALFSAIMLYYLFLKRYSKLTFYLRAFALACIYGLFSVAEVIIIYFLNRRGHFAPFSLIFYTFRFGVLIGIGMGLGIDFYMQNKDYLFRVMKIKTV